MNIEYYIEFTEYLQIVVEIIAVHVSRRLLKEIFLVVHTDFQIYIVLYSSSSGWSPRNKCKHASFLDQILEKKKRYPFFWKVTFDVLNEMRAFIFMVIWHVPQRLLWKNIEIMIVHGIYKHLIIHCCLFFWLYQVWALFIHIKSQIVVLVQFAIALEEVVEALLFLCLDWPRSLCKDFWINFILKLSMPYVVIMLWWTEMIGNFVHVLVF